MLASILPGVRQVRAPFAAGSLWFAVLWLLLEPSWSRMAESGFVAGVNGLLGAFSVLGQGIVIGFVVYFLGSFSTFLFSTALGRLIQSTRTAWRPLSGLSRNADIALKRIASNGRRDIERASGGAGLAVDRVLEGAAADAPRALPAKTRPLSRRRAPVMDGPSATGTLPDLEEKQERQIADGVLRDLPFIANTQLLGQREAVYSAVDRIEAEVEFRIALIPPVIGLSIAIAVVVRATPLLAVGAVLVGILAAIGLMLDAVRRRTQSNELILLLIQYRSISAPSITDLEARARELKDRTTGAVLARQLERYARAVGNYFGKLALVPQSGGFALLAEAHEAARVAHLETGRMQQALEAAHVSAAELDSAAVPALLDRVLAQWSAINHGVTVSAPAVAIPDVVGMSGEQLSAMMSDARQRFEDFEGDVSKIVERFRAEEKATAERKQTGEATPAEALPRRDDAAPAGAP
ncbi:hypothetical protein [uncultured Microbacterium sp.]|uniref:Uncharacterized protein n=1 Tax=uncultured Microbacterium sp. TaxID=191216 RepID=A0A1Y5P0C9_9MICO|nr:hypothetical protein [uncultured Microbacterium sp.]SBS72124.1 membrane hypothetical protein [uncultured Microbacterium sp.]